MGSENHQANTHVAVNSDEIRNKLVTIAQQTLSDNFYTSAEVLLLLYLRRVSAEEFLWLIREISSLVDHVDVLCQPCHRIRILLEFLPYAAWEFEEEWFNEQLSFLEHNADLVSDISDYDYLLILLEYRRFYRNLDYEEERAILLPLHEVILEFYRRPKREGCRYFGNAVRKLLNDPTVIMTTLQFSHRRFVRPQLEFWDVL